MRIALFVFRIKLEMGSSYQLDLKGALQGLFSYVITSHLLD